MLRIPLYFFLLLYAPVLLANEPAKITRPSPILTEPSGVGLGSFLQMFFGLAVVIGLIVGMAWFIRRMNNIPTGGQGALRVLGGISLGQRERVVLLQVGKEQIVVGLAPGQIRTLHVLEQPLENVTPARTTLGSKQEGFADRLQELLKGKINK